ncbi:MAG: hypothetical protein HQ511_14595 [Rhodospirillales bacterium]|nr:hypothetical protein [Rhodospirillales bacterium]
MLKAALIICFLTLVSLPSPAVAAEGGEHKDTEQLLESATRQILRALELMMAAIPQYEMPEVLDNGDIIIRRIQPKPDQPSPSDSDEADETST